MGEHPRNTKGTFSEFPFSLWLRNLNMQKISWANLLDKVSNINNYNSTTN